MNNYMMSRAWEEIHLDRFRENIKNIKNHLNGDTKLMAVIKADAYGHGVIEIAKCSENCGADYLAVACIEEAKQLRRHGINLPILILGATPLQAVGDLFDYDIIPTVFEETLPEAISSYGKNIGKKLKIHVKIDTGMGRIGFPCYEKENAAADAVEKISRMQGIEIEGVFTHFSCADEEDGEAETRKQFENFMYTVNELEKRDVKIPVKHCSNSAAIALYPEMNLDMVRAGIIIYGEYPSEYVKNHTSLSVVPVKEIKATVSQVKTLKKGKGISYGQHYKTVADGERLAVVCVGYADSYYRKLSGKARVLINGKSAPQVGNICMDQMLVNVSDIENVSYGTEVVLAGRSGDEFISFSELAKEVGTISYEIMCGVGKRLVKAYFDNGEFIKYVNYLENL